MTAALRFQNLTLGYDRHPAVHHLDGAVAPGTLLAVCGPNGGGKSTLFKGIVGLLTPLAGAIAVDGCGIRDIAYLPQIADIDRSFPINVYDMVAMGLWRRARLFRGLGGGARGGLLPAACAAAGSGRSPRCRGARCRARCSPACCCRTPA